MKRTKRQRIVTAYHEAGHAVIGRVLGLPCGLATIVPDHDSSGHALTPTPEETLSAWEREGKLRDMPSTIVGRIISVMAGAEAEIAILGKSSVGDGADRREIAMMLDAIGQRSLESAMRKKTAALVRRHHELIEKVAQALLAHETLDAEAINAIVEHHRSALQERIRVARHADREAMAWQFSE